MTSFMKWNQVLVIIFLMVGLSLFCGSAHGVTLGEKENCFEIENTLYRVVLLNPAAKQGEWKYGCRFVGGGWFKSIRLKNIDEELVVNDSIFPEHVIGYPAFGLAEEFLDSIKIKEIDSENSTHLKIGVGRVVRHGKNRFADTSLALFPWKTRVKTAKGGQKSIIFSQEGKYEKYAYRLVKTAAFDETPFVTFTTVLKNTGRETIETDLYLHPFFKFNTAGEDYWYAITKNPSDPELIKKDLPVPVSDDFIENMDILDYNTKNTWFLTGNRKTGNCIGLSSDNQVSKVSFWKSPTCYAIEPFIKIKVLPKESITWKWIFLFQSSN